MDPKEPKDGDGGGDVISLDDARKKAGESDTHQPQQTMTLDGGEFLKPVMAAIARELASVADPDGVVRVGGTDEASRAKTAAVVKGLGVGLGQALAEAFGKWAQKIETGQVKGPEAEVTMTTTSSDETNPDPDKKPS
jgi:hypothetical protein